MSTRRDFLRSLVVAAPALVVGDAALEAFARLTHERKSFASAWPMDGIDGELKYSRVVFMRSRKLGPSQLIVSERMMRDMYAAWYSEQPTLAGGLFGGSRS